MRFIRIIDLTMPLDPRTVWMREGAPDPAQEGSGMWGRERETRAWRETLSIERVLEPPPNSGLLEFITMNAHTGTHVNSEYQQDPKGQMLFDMPLDAFCGEAVVLDMSFVGEWKTITRDHLEKVTAEIERDDTVFMYSNYSERKNAPLLLYESGLWLSDKGIKGHGIGG